MFRKFEWTRWLLMSILVFFTFHVVARASGSTVINYTSCNELGCLAVAPPHAWIGTEGGLLLFNTNTLESRKFTPADWLGTCGISHVDTDGRGITWASTDRWHAENAGLIAFDGLEWTWDAGSSPLDSECWQYGSIAADQLGNVWLAKEACMLLFTGTEWRCWDTSGNDDEVVRRFGDVAAKTGVGWSLWNEHRYAGSGWDDTLMLCRFRGFDLGWWEVPVLPCLADTAVDLSGNVWLSTFDSLFYFDGQSFGEYRLPDSPWERVTHLRADNKNTKWVIGSRRGNQDADVALLSEDGTWSSYPELLSRQLGIERAKDIRFDQSNGAWVIPWNIRGEQQKEQPLLVRYDGKNVESFWWSDDFADTTAKLASVDEKGNLWLVFGHHLGDYLYEWDGMELHVFAPGERELPDRIDSMTVEPHGTVWFGTEEGAYSFDGEDWALHLPGRRMANVKISPDDVIWVIYSEDSSYSRKAAFFDRTSWTDAYQPDFSGQEISDIAFGSDGIMWFSCEDGYWQDYEGSTPDYYGGIRSWDGEIERKYLTGRGFDAIAVDQNDVVWATFGGLARIENSNAEIVPMEQLANCYTYGPLLVDTQGRKWCSAKQMVGYLDFRPGLLRIDHDEDVRFYSTSDGLCSNEINDLDEDAYGNLWVSTERGISVLIEDSSIELEAATFTDQSWPPNLAATGSLSFLAPATNVDLYVALQAPSGQVFYVAPRTAEPFFPIFYAAFEGSTEFLEPGPDYEGPGSFPNTPDMKDLAAPALPLPDPPGGDGPTGLALFAYPVPYFANVPLPAYTAIADVALLNTTLPESSPAGTYTFHIGITAPASISNVYRTASTTFEVTAE